MGIYRLLFSAILLSNLLASGSLAQPRACSSLPSSVARLIDTVAGIETTERERETLCEIATQVLHRLPGDRAEQARIAARGAWWSLQEGIARLPNPHSHNKCTPESGGADRNVGPLESARDPGVCGNTNIWQVGLAGVQVLDKRWRLTAPGVFCRPDGESLPPVKALKDYVSEIFGPTSKIDDVIEQSARLWGLSSSERDEVLERARAEPNGDFAKSWVLRHPVIGLTVEVQGALRCDGCIVDDDDGSWKVKAGRGCTNRSFFPATQWAPDPSKSSAVIEALERFFLAVPSEPVAAALVIDSSGSMAWNDPKELRKDGAKIFVEALNERDQVAIIDFDSRAIVRWPRQPVASDRGGLIDAINRIDSSGGTSLSVGLSAAFLELGKAVEVDDPTRRAVVFLTDGQGDYNNEADLFALQGWPIYTVGLGADVDSALLSTIASATDGTYFQLSDPQDLVKVYFDIQAQIGGGEVIEELQLLVRLGETVRSVFATPAGQALLRVLTSWSGSEVTTMLVSPSGEVIAPQSLPEGVEYIKGLTHELYKVFEPESGEWEVLVFGSDVPPEGERVVVLVSANGAIGGVCGDGIRAAGEACDDGNTVSGDGCSADCQSDESCGNGLIDVAEECDDGNVAVGDGCDAGCRLESQFPGDLDRDGDTDRDDLAILLSDRGKSVMEAVCGTECDLDGDTMVTILDARKLVLMCTRPRCATQ